MALTKEINIARFEINQENKTLSIRLDTVIKEDGVELNRSSHRKAFVPGDLNRVKEYINMDNSPEITYLSAFWTQQVINDYEAMILAQE